MVEGDNRDRVRKRVKSLPLVLAAGAPDVLSAARMTQTPPALTRLAALMMALAMMARLLVPAGFMPMTGADGAPTLVMCTGTGPMAMPAMARADTRRHDPAQGHDADHACPFAAMAAAADFARAPLPPLAFAAIVAVTLAAVHHSIPGRGLAAPPPPKTGPPLLR